MPLIRGIARTAVIAGTASAVSGRVQRRQQNKWAQQDGGAEQDQQQYADAPPEPAAAPDPIERLKELAQLHDQGVLTDEEFSAEKSKVLSTT